MGHLTRCVSPCGHPLSLPLALFSPRDVIIVAFPALGWTCVGRVRRKNSTTREDDLQGELEFRSKFDTRKRVTVMLPMTMTCCECKHVYHSGDTLQCEQVAILHCAHSTIIPPHT